MKIHFYENGLAPGEIAQFAIFFPAPWGGEMKVRGVIIDSVKYHRNAIVWYRVKGSEHGRELFPAHPDGRGMNEHAEAWIFDRYRSWKNLGGGQCSQLKLM